MHDYFAILGIAPGAPASVIRSAHSRRCAAVHPDFRARVDRPSFANAPEGSPGDTRRAGSRAGQDPAGPADASVNFVEMSAMVDGIEAAFFRSGG